MKTLEDIAKEYETISIERDKLTSELLRLEGEARFIKSMNTPVEELKEEVKK